MLYFWFLITFGGKFPAFTVPKVMVLSFNALGRQQQPYVHRQTLQKNTCIASGSFGGFKFLDLPTQNYGKVISPSGCPRFREIRFGLQQIIPFVHFKIIVSV